MSSSIAPRVLVVDNHDSFVWTLVGYLEQLGASPRLVREGDAMPRLAEADAVLLSSGSGHPGATGRARGAVAACAQDGVPLLGIGLGHQLIAAAFGAEIVRAAEPRHGKTVHIDHDATGVLTELPSPMRVTCYHSSVVDERGLEPALRVTARGPRGIVMALAHRELAIHGVQFHPESVLTEHGYHLLGNWLAMAGDTEAPARGARLAPLLVP